MTLTFPLALNLSTHIPGAGAGDNLYTVWSFWWMREVRDTGGSFFRTDHLFAPYGADLTLHTHTALLAYLGATVLKSFTVIEATNLGILLSLWLNGVCAYLLAWRLVRDRSASLVAGVIFAASAFIAARLNGHFNLTSAWTIPAFALAVVEGLNGSRRWAVAAGIILAATAYLDYYYVVYQLVIAVCLMGARRPWSVRLRGATPRSLVLARMALVMLAVDLAVIAAIAATGGIDTRVMGIRVRATDIFNPLQALWVFSAIVLWMRGRPTIQVAPNTARPHREYWPFVIGAAVFVLLASPLLWNSIELMRSGEYVSQTYFWRSAPKGIDVATLVLGHPYHALYGEHVQDLYRRLQIDPIESVGWIGILPLLLAIPSARRWADPAARAWTLIGIVFFLWALGPHLMVFGRNTGMILPQTLIRYVPIVSNARMPGRAMVVVFLALGILSALTIARLRRTGRASVWPLAAVVAICAENWVAPFPLTRLETPPIYDTLRARPEVGSLCELPLGIGDGLSGMLHGTFDAKSLFYQTVHERPIVGGTMARLPPAVIAGYAADPLISALMRLSEGAAADAVGAPDRLIAADRLQANGVAFVMLNRTTAPAALVDYVDQVLPLTRLADDGTRTLYAVVR